MNKLVSELISKAVARNVAKFEIYLDRLETASHVLNLISNAMAKHLEAMRDLQPHYSEMNRRFYEAALTGDTVAFLDWLDDVANLVKETDPAGAQMCHRLVNDLRERHAISHGMPFNKRRPVDFTSSDASVN